MNTAAHPIAPEEVMAFLDGELLPDQARAVSTHIESCKDCNATVSRFREVSERFASWKVEALKLEAEALRAAPCRTNSGLGFLFSVPALWGLAAIAAALLLAVVLSFREGRSTYDRWAPMSKRTVQLSSPPPPPPPGTVVRGGSDAITSFGRNQQQLDSNGQLQGRVEESGKSFSMDGQPRPDQDQALSSVVAGPMIARTVSISVVVKDFTAARANLDAILRRHHGYAANLTANTAENAPRSIEASLRVPAPELDAALADLKALGKVQQESQNGEEVTQQHADLVARLKNSRETEQRLRAILEQRTGKVKDVLEVEQEIARVRGEIEEMEAEQKNLEHRVDFATVNFSLAEEYKAQLVPPAISTGTRLHNALVEGYRGASETLLGIVLFFAEYTLTLLLWGVILLLPAFLLWRRYRRSLAAVYWLLMNCTV